MIKRLLKIKRYFLVSYCSQTVTTSKVVPGYILPIDSKKHVDGMLQFTTNGCFLNYPKCAQQIKDFVIQGEQHWELENVIITNILEVSKRDYKDWIKNENEKVKVYKKPLFYNR
jgi:hypothetical protein